MTTNEAIVMLENARLRIEAATAYLRGVEASAEEVGDELVSRDVKIGSLYSELSTLSHLLNSVTALAMDGQRYGCGSKVYYVDPVGYVQGLDVGLKFQTDSSAPEQVYHPYPVFADRANAEKYRDEKHRNSVGGKEVE